MTVASGTSRKRSCALPFPIQTARGPRPVLHRVDIANYANDVRRNNTCEMH